MLFGEEHVCDFLSMVNKAIIGIDKQRYNQLLFGVQQQMCGPANRSSRMTHNLPSVSVFSDEPPNAIIRLTVILELLRSEHHCRS